MSIIHDPIYGDISLSNIALKILDHPIFDRTQYIYQTGNAYRVYPSATHTRKIHLIGTYALTQRLLTHLSRNYHITNRMKELISIGGLCHDIGHGPGSHVFDKHVIPKMVAHNSISMCHPWSTHEKRSCVLFREMAKDLKCFSEEEIQFVCNVIEPSPDLCSWEYSIVNNNQHGIDTDKLDYIVRDNYMFGLRLDIDVDRIVKNSCIINNEWSFSKYIHDELLNVIFVRYRQHRLLNTAQIVKFDLAYCDLMTLSKQLYRHITEMFINQDVHAFVHLTDSYVLHHGHSHLLCQYKNRNTYKLISKEHTSVPLNNDLNLAIQICKEDKCTLAYVPFYDPNTLEKCEVRTCPLDVALPSCENIIYDVKKKQT